MPLPYARHAYRGWDRLTHVLNVFGLGLLQFIFQALGMRRHKLRLSVEEWQAARPIAAQLTGVSNISYEPEFSPIYVKAYQYMAPDYLLDRAVNASPTKVGKVVASSKAVVPTKTEVCPTASHTPLGPSFQLLSTIIH